MYASHVLSLVFLCVLGLCALSCSLPAPSAVEQPEGSQPLSPRLDNARRMWNGAKRAQKRLSRRTRREVTNSNDIDQAIFNITGQRFIIDLYRNLTNSTVLHAKTQANTIRSLTYNSAVNTPCGVFNFTLSAVNSSEFVLNAELHLYANNPFPDVSTYFVKITAQLANGEVLSNKSKVTEVRLATDGYVVLPLEELTKVLITIGEPHAVFRVRVYKDIPDLGNKNPVPCNDIEFVNKDFTEENLPIFIVYSYNPKIEKINYQDIANGVIENMLLQDAEDSAPTQAPTRAPTQAPAPAVSAAGSNRRKREIPNCQVNDLIVDGSSIFNLMVGSTASNFRVGAPTSYNAGICGGSCENVLIPDSLTSNHAPFVYLLVEQQAFKQKHQYTFERCCAPVKYGPLTVFSYSDGSASINVIEDLIIKECECLDIIKLSDPV